MTSVASSVVGPVPFVLYELPVGQLSIDVGGLSLDISELLSNGRATYTIFQRIVGMCLGLSSNSEGGDSDLMGTEGSYEVKAYPDVELHPRDKDDLFHTAASSTFPANNLGPEVKALLAAGKYDEALVLCRRTGFDKNDFYIYTNTSKYDPSVPLRFMVLPVATVLELLSKDDPRLINRRDLLALCETTTRVILS